MNEHREIAAEIRKKYLDKYGDKIDGLIDMVNNPKSFIPQKINAPPPLMLRGESYEALRVHNIFFLLQRNGFEFHELIILKNDELVSEAANKIRSILLEEIDKPVDVENREDLFSNGSPVYGAVTSALKNIATFWNEVRRNNGIPIQQF